MKGQTTEKARAAKIETSRRVYEETKQATLPPKPIYRTSDGKTVNVRTGSVQVDRIRQQPSNYYNSEARQDRISIHINQHGYQHPYDWYYTQPHYHVGGGYSSAYWWMMMEWNAERRARWLYHNQAVIEREAYERGVRDAAVAQHVANFQAQGIQPDPNYVDNEFTTDPGAMYTQDYIEAAYNPTVAPALSIPLTYVAAGVIILVLLGAAYVVVFRVRWGT